MLCVPFVYFLFQSFFSAKHPIKPLMTIINIIISLFFTFITWVIIGYADTSLSDHGEFNHHVYTIIDSIVFGIAFALLLTERVSKRFHVHSFFTDIRDLTTAILAVLFSILYCYPTIYFVSKYEVLIKSCLVEKYTNEVFADFYYLLSNIYIFIIFMMLFSGLLRQQKSEVTDAYFKS